MPPAIQLGTLQPGYLRTPRRIARPPLYDIQDEMKILKQQPKPLVKLRGSSWKMDARRRIECEKCCNPHSRREDGSCEIT
uniref:Uncharacterized protein n=1 Tax=Angiostrongylus cantonensis TaxID=6313 RepID=A0A0K0CT43_ANGCA